MRGGWERACRAAELRGPRAERPAGDGGVGADVRRDRSAAPLQSCQDRVRPLAGGLHYIVRHGALGFRDSMMPGERRSHNAPPESTPH